MYKVRYGALEDHAKGFIVLFSLMSWQGLKEDSIGVQMVLGVLGFHSVGFGFVCMCMVWRIVVLGIQAWVLEILEL